MAKRIPWLGLGNRCRKNKVIQKEDIVDENTIQMIRLKQLFEFQKSCNEIFKIRNMEYGDAIRIGGFIGAVTTLTTDAARLHQLTFKGLGTGDSQLVDALRDIANYAAIANMMLEDKNIQGGFNAPYPEEVKPK